MSEHTSFLITQLLWFLGTVLFFAGAAKVTLFLINRIVRSSKDHEQRHLWEMLFAALGRPLSNLIALWGVSVGFERTEIVIGEWSGHLIDNAIFVCGAAIVVSFTYKLVNTLLDYYARLSSEQGDDEVGRTVMPTTKKLVKIFMVVAGMIVILDRFGYNVSSLVAALGVTSLAIGFAAKDTLANMIAGFVILADRPFRVGDRIEVEDKIGEVVEIGLRSTKVRTFENTIVVYPNSRLVDNVLVNYAYPEESLAYFYKIGVEYGSDVDKTKSVLLEVARAIPEIIDDPPSDVYFTDHGDSSLEFNLVYNMHDYHDRWVALDKVNTMVNRRFAEEGIVVAFPTRTVHLNNAYHKDSADAAKA